MKIGLVLECGRDGPDERVCRHLITRIRPELEISCATLSNKPQLIEGCGIAAAALINEGCAKVLIIWDLHPTWREAAPCRKKDREAVLLAVQAAGANAQRVKLVCITEELEAWLISDAKAVIEYTSTPVRQVKFASIKKPETVNPKTLLRKVFQTSKHRDYRDYEHALPLAKKANLAQLRRVPSFARFEQFVLAC